MSIAAIEIEVLNDLIKINNDRIAGYEKAIADTESLDFDLKTLFEGMVQESQGFKLELVEKVASLGGEIASDTTLSGKLYRAWMDLKKSITGTDRTAILNSCAFGEDAWQKAYEAALATESGLAAETRQLISRQYNAEQQSHDLIKKYRDAHAAMG